MDLSFLGLGRARFRFDISIQPIPLPFGQNNYSNIIWAQNCIFSVNNYIKNHNNMILIINSYIFYNPKIIILGFY